MKDLSTVYIYDSMVSHPTFHDYGRIKGNTDVTRCGLVMYDGKVRYAAVIRRDHAQRFASPCRNCFRGSA